MASDAGPAGLSRRAALIGGAGALLATPALPARAQGGAVVVVGAGAAGLSAAETLRRAGRPFVLLEARGRIGGRAHTDRALGPDCPFDAGAQYIHFAEQNPWAAIARADGVGIAPEDGFARTLVVDGRPATEAERADRRAAFAALDALLTPRDPDVSMAEAARAGGPALERAAEGLGRLLLGEEPERVSLADYARLWNGADLWVDGYGDLVARHFAHLPVRLTCPVTALDASGAGVRVETACGALEAPAAIVAVPLGVLKVGAIRFSPGLPEAIEAALAGLGMGAYTKVALRLDPARIDARALGDAVSVARDEPTIYFEMAPFGRPMAVANLGGDRARELCRLGEAAALSHVTDRLAGVFGGQVRAAVTAGRLAGWWTDPLSRGAYSVAAPGHAAARAALRAPIAERIFLAGEALGEGGAMTVGGATLDGARAAEAVIRVLPA